MDANANPNLFRLSLPEWLKDEIDEGNHKGVYWIDKEKKIFHVPWKHASRNGWEEKDVSLFKAWAIYTNRFREGIDKPRPASWKTNFRCAINSHNSIVFLKDQGQKKGESAHRVMQLLDIPKKPRKIVNSSRNFKHEDEVRARKLVRLTYPTFNHEKASTKVASLKNSKGLSNSTVSPSQESNCQACSQMKTQIKNALAFDTLRGEESDLLTTVTGFNAEYRAKFVEMLTSNEHICLKETANEPGSVKKCDAQTENESKANLQDLYKIGKALQESISEESLKSKEEVAAEEIINDNPESEKPAAVIIALNNDCSEEVVVNTEKEVDAKISMKSSDLTIDNAKPQSSFTIENLDFTGRGPSFSKSSLVFNGSKKLIAIKTDLGTIPVVIYDINQGSSLENDDVLINPRK